MGYDKIKGLTVEIGGDTSDLTAALRSVDKESKKSSDELREINRLLKLDPKNTELLAQKQKVLAEAIGTAKKRLETLQSAEKNAREQFERGEIGAEQLRALQRETISAGQRLESLQRDYAEVENAAKNAGNAIEDSGKDAAEAAKDTETLEKELDGLKDKYNDAKDAAKDAGKELAATAAAAAAGVGVTLNTAMSKEDALASIQAQTGKSADEMERLGDAMDAVYRSGYGEDLDDVASAMATIAQLSGETKSSALTELTKDAIALRDTFGYETAESMRAAKMLVDQFGVSYADAFDLIAQGTQDGLNRSGDLLDIINEYSVHYKALGYGATEFLGSLENGAAAGAFSVDKLGDAMKEFGVRTKDGSDSTKEAFTRLHLDADIMTEKFAAGGDSAREASDAVLTALLRMDDQVAQNEVGVALFGTMWEDLGIDAVSALMDVNTSISVTKDTMEDIKEIKYNTVSAEWRQLGRTVQTELIAPLGEDLLPLAQKFCSYLINNLDDLLPLVKKIATIAGAMFVGAKVGKMVSSVAKLVSTYKQLKTATTAANAAMATTPWGAVGAAIGLVVGGIVSLIQAEDDAAEAERERVKELKAAADEQTQAYRDIADAAAEAADARRDMAKAVNDEYDSYDELWAELELLVDAEGRVLEGNEERVDFIRSVLSDAMGDEIELIDGQIQKYGELRDTIADTLALKRGETLATDQKSAYDAAKNDITTLQTDYEAANAVAIEYTERQAKLAKQQAELDALLAEESTVSASDYEYWEEREQTLSNAIAANQEWLDAHPNAIEDQRATRANYDNALATISLYESLMDAIYSKDTETILAATQALETSMTTFAHGAAYTTLYDQALGLYSAYQTASDSSKLSGSTYTAEQLEGMQELVAKAVYEAYIAAQAEGATQETLSELLNMLSDSGYAEYLEGMDAYMGSVDAFLTYLQNPAPVSTTAAERWTPADAGTLAAEVASRLVRQLDDMHLMPDYEQSAEDTRAEIIETNELLRGVIRAIDALDLSVVVDGESVVERLSSNINNTLGITISRETRGRLK